MGKEPRAQFPKPRHHYFRIECAWCKRFLGWKPKNVSVPGDTTYGICPPCVAGLGAYSTPKLPPIPRESCH
jgi:hypothetical protein